MAAIAQSAPHSAERIFESDDRASGLAKLAELHAEAEETARLANLLGRSLYVAISLALFGVVTVTLSDGVNLVRQVVWCGFVATASVAILVAYAHAMRQPFERFTLKTFASDITAILLFAGFAWGAGAFLVLPAGTGVVSSMLFAVVPAVAIGAFLREREALFLFLAPVTGLTAFASVLVPFADGMLGAGMILVASAAVAGGAVLLDRRPGDSGDAAMLGLS
jgi:hypothetical protein